MTPPAPTLPPFPTRRAALRLTAAAGVAAVAALTLTAITGPIDQIASLLASGGLCLVASLLSLEVMRRAATADLQRFLLAAMATFPLRLALVGAGVAFTGFTLGSSWLPLILWTLLFYLVLLGVEVSAMVGYLRDATAAGAIPPAMKGTVTHA